MAMRACFACARMSDEFRLIRKKARGGGGGTIPSALISDANTPRILVETFSLASAQGRINALSIQSVDPMVTAMVAGTLSFKNDHDATTKIAASRPNTNKRPT